MEIWRLKDNGGHKFDLLGSRDVIGYVTIRLSGTEFLWVVHRDRSSDKAVYFRPWAPFFSNTEFSGCTNVYRRIFNFGKNI